MTGCDVLIVGGGTAGCVLATRLSENRNRSVCLLEAGPDYGPLEGGRWPADILDASRLTFAHDWGAGGEDERSFGARVIGGSSTQNACVIVRGSPNDYDEWGPAWRYEEFAPYLDRAAAAFGTAKANTTSPAPSHTAFIHAAHAAGFPILDDPNDPRQPVGVAPYPANVVDGMRRNAAIAYLDGARARSNLTVVDDVLVDRVTFDGRRATGVISADGREFRAATIVLSAGAYFSPAILLRSGIGPAAELERLGLPVIAALPVGERLLDHCGTDISWTLTGEAAKTTHEHVLQHSLFQSHVVVKAASSSCPPGTWDLHLISWLSCLDDDYVVSVAVFHMKPLSSGRLRLRTTDPGALPLVERRFLSDSRDTRSIVEGIELARTIAATEPLAHLIAEEQEPAELDLEEYVRETTRTYFHPAGTCPIGAVVDENGRVLGIDGLVVADASIMPTIPRANTNLTTAAIAERLSESI